MKQTRFEQLKDEMQRRLGPERGPRITAVMDVEYKAMSKAYENQPEALHNHTHNNIFPVAAAFRALMADGMTREEAASFAGDAFLKLMDAPASSIRKMLKIPGLYRLMPRIWKTAMPRMFGENAGFRYRFYPADSRQVRFDMLECPYYRICRELDCEEIAGVFCTTDDICYGHMHPKLIWNRTKTLARGGDCCDFDLYIPR